MKNKKTTNVKKTRKSAEKSTKSKTVVKVDQKQKDFQRLEEYLNESGLSLAFNIIFAELISKQILPENYFTYTSMRLTQIGKEIEGLKTKEIIYVEEEKEEEKVEENLQEKAEQTDLPPPTIEDKEEIFMTNPPQKSPDKDKNKNKANEKDIKDNKAKDNNKEKQNEKKSDGKKTVKKKK